MICTEMHCSGYRYEHNYGDPSCDFADPALHEGDLLTKREAAEQADRAQRLRDHQARKDYDGSQA